ncbi:hypothetical protein J0A68_15185 [Algoriphagus sp. H41]|uniref:Uncharacterized protein n=1 Tax=Algoriphagus oliviformis TaxID=2811231 RepID=A0ABS3C808_9BACT|nr:hypothetical protein [Algoriphagus oliviformis]MBN7812296.1 hypothetical protein [Algoriphagus oliviformis]
MAKTNEQFDQHFREKLDGHREKPSALAWERLESQLPEKSKPKLGVWWAVAASVTALLVAGYAFWPSGEQDSAETFLAEKIEMPVEVQPEGSIEAPQASLEEEQKTSTEAGATEESKPVKQPEQSQKPVQKTKPTPIPAQAQPSQNLIAQAETKTTNTPIVAPLPTLQTEELEVAIPELKAPQIERSLAEANSKAEDEPLYRVSIYSNGIKKAEPVDKNLITELGKTVGQVEGLLGKVDEGFAELQDRKDNLFAGGISIKKDRAER